jgi:type IV pilus assembly protein PilW
MKSINNKLSNSKGFTLVEVLVSMTIGLGLLGGMMSMYFGSKVSDKTRTELSDMDANATVALRTLRKTIQHAGYSTIAITALNKSFYTESDGALTDTEDKNPFCRDGGKLIVSGLGGNRGLLNPPARLTGYTKDNAYGDVVTVIYRPDSPDKGYLYSDCALGRYKTGASTEAEDNARLVACSTDTIETVSPSILNGMNNPNDAKVYSAFFLRSYRSSTGTSKQLVCYGSRSRDPDPYVIADNIDNLQLRYGVRTGNQTEYKKAADITTDDEWSTVNSVQIAILVGSEDRNLLENPVSRSYTLLDDVTIAKSANDKRMYKAYSTTVYLHNIGMK